MPNKGIPSSAVRVYLTHAAVNAGAQKRIDQIEDNFTIEGWGQMNTIQERTGVGRNTRIRRDAKLTDWKQFTINYDVSYGAGDRLGRDFEMIEADAQGRLATLELWFNDGGTNKDRADFLVQEIGTPIPMGEFVRHTVICSPSENFSKTRA